MVGCDELGAFVQTLLDDPASEERHAFIHSTRIGIFSLAAFEQWQEGLFGSLVL
jgi:hypothetical protein